MDYDQIRRYMGNDLIEIAPLAYMRGRTLNDAVIILDEGQNATVPQMKMFLTRMGQNARIVVTGDVTQVDLPPATVSGLADAVERLQDGAGRRDGLPRQVGHRPAPAGAGDRQRLRRHRTGRGDGLGPHGGATAPSPATGPPPPARPPRSEAGRGPARPRLGGTGRAVAPKPCRRRRGALRRGAGLRPVDHAWPRRFHELW